MKERICAYKIFVMPSIIENHSSSLREAMYLGVPCISSVVGSVPVYVWHGENALLYRYEEYEVLAAQMIEMFLNEDKALRIGLNGYDSIRKRYDQEYIGIQMQEMYREVVDNESA